jgi:hypothetical protein
VLTKIEHACCLLQLVSCLSWLLRVFVENCPSFSMSLIRVDANKREKSEQYSYHNHGGGVTIDGPCKTDCVDAWLKHSYTGMSWLNYIIQQDCTKGRLD